MCGNVLFVKPDYLKCDSTRFIFCEDHVVHLLAVDANVDTRTVYPVPECQVRNTLNDPEGHEVNGWRY